jgi:hypothetical protein
MCKINFKMPVFPEGITDAERRSIMFEALSALDLSSLVEKRENLTYLSWANCFSVLKQIYPLATYRVIKNPATGLPFFTDPAVGIFVYTEVEIEGITTECFLPVMDNKNKAMKLEPYTYQVWDNYKKSYVDKTVNAATSFDINRTIWRALVKNVALATGIGLYIYQGEDVPSLGDDTTSSAPQQTVRPVQQPVDPLAPIKNAINSMVDVNSLMNLYFDHQNEVEGNPEIKALFTQRRQQLQLLAGRK